MADAPPVTRNRRVLVVDDEPHIRRVLEVALGVRGFEVMLASDGKRGLDELDQEAVDLAILDFMMPGVSALEVLAKIRPNPHRADTPVIILTEKGQDADREAALTGGATDFLTKPFSPKKLIVRIEEILDDT